MSPALAATLQLAAGTGHVVRRAESLLFLPEPDDTVRAAFIAAAPGDELQAVASATVAAGFDVGRYACVAWGQPVRVPRGVMVVVFGDVAVETDQPSVPMFTGAGSRTWVEQTVPVDGSATILVVPSGDDADAVTDLRDGTAHAAGFVLALTNGSDDADRPVAAAEPAATVLTPPADTDPTTALPAPTAPPPDVPPPAPTADTAPSDDPAPEAPANDVEPGEPSPRPTPHAVASDVARDPALALAAIQAAAMNDEGEPVQGHDTPPPDEPVPMAATSVDVLDRPPLDNLDDDHTLPPPDAGDLLADLDADGRGALVEAKLCPDGHANPPMVATCTLCGALLSPAQSAVTHVRRPSLGALRLDDGTDIELDAELLIGRNPARDDQAGRAELRRVQVVGDKVSRSHLEVRFQGWDVLVIDCGTTNGTFVVPHPGGQVVALEPGRAHLVEADAVVYFGSRSFTVVGRQR